MTVNDEEWPSTFAIVSNAAGWGGTVMTSISLNAYWIWTNITYDYLTIYCRIKINPGIPNDYTIFVVFNVILYSLL